MNMNVIRGIEVILLQNIFFRREKSNDLSLITSWSIGHDEKGTDIEKCVGQGFMIIERYCFEKTNPIT